jgi:hypothetical protein
MYFTVDHDTKFQRYSSKVFDRIDADGQTSLLCVYFITNKLSTITPDRFVTTCTAASKIPTSCFYVQSVHNIAVTSVLSGLTLLLYDRENQHSNLVSGTAYSHWNFQRFPRSFQANAWIILQIRPRQLPSTSFPLRDSSIII